MSAEHAFSVTWEHDELRLWTRRPVLVLDPVQALDLARLLESGARMALLEEETHSVRV